MPEGIDSLVAARFNFEKVLVSHLPVLQRAALALTRNKSAAEDLVQDAAVKIIAAKDSFIPGTNFAAWSRRILYNHFISSIRGKKEFEMSDEAELRLERLNVGENQIDRIVVEETLAAIAELPENQRQALMGIVADGLDYEALSERDDASVGTLKNRVHRARMTLEKRINGDGKRLPLGAASPKDFFRPVSRTVHSVTHMAPARPAVPQLMNDNHSVQPVREEVVAPKLPDAVRTGEINILSQGPEITQEQDGAFQSPAMIAEDAVEPSRIPDCSEPVLGDVPEVTVSASAQPGSQSGLPAYKAVRLSMVQNDRNGLYEKLFDSEILKVQKRSEIIAYVLRLETFEALGLLSSASLPRLGPYNTWGNVIRGGAAIFGILGSDRKMVWLTPQKANEVLGGGRIITAAPDSGTPSLIDQPEVSPIHSQEVAAEAEALQEKDHIKTIPEETSDEALEQAATGIAQNQLDESSFSPGNKTFLSVGQAVGVSAIQNKRDMLFDQLSGHIIIPVQRRSETIAYIMQAEIFDALRIGRLSKSLPSLGPYNTWGNDINGGCAIFGVLGTPHKMVWLTPQKAEEIMKGEIKNDLPVQDNLPESTERNSGPATIPEIPNPSQRTSKRWMPPLTKNQKGPVVVEFPHTSILSDRSALFYALSDHRRTIKLVSRGHVTGYVIHGAAYDGLKGKSSAHLLPNVGKTEYLLRNIFAHEAVKFGSHRHNGHIVFVYPKAAATLLADRLNIAETQQAIQKSVEDKPASNVPVRAAVQGNVVADQAPAPKREVNEETLKNALLKAFNLALEQGKPVSVKAGGVKVVLTAKPVVDNAAPA